MKKRKAKKVSKNKKNHRRKLRVSFIGLNIFNQFVIEVEAPKLSKKELKKREREEAEKLFATLTPVSLPEEKKEESKVVDSQAEIDEKKRKANQKKKDKKK